MNAHERHSTPARVGAYWAWNLSEGGVRCRLLSEPAIGLSEVTPAQECYAAGTKKRPQQDSNLRTRLRRPMLYPLSYGGSSAVGKGTSEWALPGHAAAEYPATGQKALPSRA